MTLKLPTIKIFENLNKIFKIVNNNNVNIEIINLILIKNKLNFQVCDIKASSHLKFCHRPELQNFGEILLFEHLSHK